MEGERGPSYNKTVSGFGRLWRPPSQPATSLAESGSQISVGKVAEPGNPLVKAGSETAERYGKPPMERSKEKGLANPAQELASKSPRPQVAQENQVFFRI